MRRRQRWLTMSKPPFGLRERQCVEDDHCRQWCCCWDEGGRQVETCLCGTFCAPCVYGVALETLRKEESQGSLLLVPHTPNGCCATCVMSSNDCAVPLAGSSIWTHHKKDETLTNPQQCWYLWVHSVPCWFCAPCELRAQLRDYKPTDANSAKLLEAP